MQLVSEETWPIQTLKPLDKNGIYSHNEGTYRVFTKKVFHSGDLQIEILDSNIERGRPAHFFEELRKINHQNFEFPNALPTAHIPDLKAALDAGEDPAYLYNRWGLVFPLEWGRKAEANMVEAGLMKQKLAVEEVLDFVFPLYRERRHWTDEFIESLTEKAFESMNDTRYVVIRKKPNGSNKNSPIIATIGLTKKTYGRVKFFNSITQMWEERTGSFGGTFDENNYSETHLGGDIPLPDMWTKSVELLPMEKVFGETAFLPRPATLQTFQIPSELSVNALLKNALAARGFGLAKRAANSRFARQWPEGIEADLTKPVEFYSGQIFEPTKFAVAKGEELRSYAKKEILMQIFAAVFPESQNSTDSLKRQFLYTYNDHDGTIMYRRLGFNGLPAVKPKFVDGTEWYALGLSPEDMANQLLHKSQLSDEQAAEIIDRLENSLMSSISRTH
jgi:hypothetical protein